VKKLKFLLVMAALLTTFSLIGCDSDSGSDEGTIVIKNTSPNAKINWVQISDVDTGAFVFNDRVDIPARDGSKSFSNIAPGKYLVTVSDDMGGADTSDQITIAAKQTITLTYNGSDIYR